jgi:hypothetical protein
VPTAEELHAFYRARSSAGLTTVKRDPYLRFVTGGFSGTTDEIIQWAAWKWGIPADWLRAVYVDESWWRQSARGDLHYVGLTNVWKYPPQSRQTNGGGAYTGRVWESLGLSQVKWRPDGSLGSGTEPLRWKSTAFSVDYHAATVRWFYDNPGHTRSAWGDTRYRPHERWLSIGGWYEPYPWNNAQQRDYVSEVQQILAERTWTRPGF